MADELMKYDVDGDGIATIAWDLPGRSQNVMNRDSMEAFAAAARKALADDAVKGVVVTSAKRDFIAGGDLDMLQRMEGAEASFEWMMGFHTLTREIETGGKPFVAAINGTALGGGLEIALACHRRIAADSPKARIGLPEAQVGLFPGGGGTQRLPRLIGIQPALPLLLEGKRLEVGKAKEMGIVDEVVPADEVVAAAKKWIQDGGEPVQPWDQKRFKVPGGDVESPQGYQTFIAGNAMLHARTFGNYPNAEAIMSCVYEGLKVPIDVGLRVEARWFAKIVGTPEARHMIRTLFWGIQAANKLASRPEGVANADYRKVGVLGAGMMGHGIAHAAAQAGLEVVMIDESQEAADAGKEKIAALFDKGVKRGKLSREARDEALGRVTATTDYDALKGAELVVEAVVENRKVKADVTAKAEAQIGADAVFASNTSTLPISGLAEASARPENFIGLHFFSPVNKMPLVEIIVGEKTSKETLAKAMDFVKRIAKTPIVVNDSRGFFTSRVFATYVQEGLAMLAEGVKPALIENAGRMAGMPVGPLALADEVSIGLMHHVMKQTREDLGDAYEPRPADDVIVRMVEQLGRTGKKDGKGFYEYPSDDKKRLWPDLAKEWPAADDQPDVEKVKRRLLHIQALETARCMEEGVITEARDADVGSILGWGFAPFTGGVLSYVEMVGVDRFVRECEALAQSHGPRFQPPKLLEDMAAKGELFYPQAEAAA